jgi:hypothetical protein
VVCKAGDGTPRAAAMEGVFKSAILRGYRQGRLPASAMKEELGARHQKAVNGPWTTGEC